MQKETYYKKFENREPYVPQSASYGKLVLINFFSTFFIVVGSSYLFWRWAYSLNPYAMWFSLPLVIAETLMFFGSLLMIINHWSISNISKKKPVRYLSEIDTSISVNDDRPIIIDLYIATYNEERIILEDTIKDAKKIKYPYKDVKINIFLCDDGQRDGRDPGKENFKKLASDYNINYFVRENNKGFKAGNLNNAFWQTDGDLIVILDADTRLFKNFLVNMTGYFRDSKMAWVQSPQWFYDLPEGKNLQSWIYENIPLVGKKISSFVPFLRKIHIGKNIFGTDPRIFYDVILRHRNSKNAAFCCGAGSVQRRSALERLIANKSKLLIELDSTISLDRKKIKNKKLIDYIEEPNTIVGPFAHHISEDIFTSILLHSEKENWKSYQHPDVECKMLSPQTAESYTKQYSRYAEGTFDIFFSKNNPIIKKGLSIGQRLAYAETIYSYFSPFWVIILLLSPVVFYLTLVPPIKAFNFDFFIRFFTFMLCNQILISLVNWGVPTKRSEQYFIGGFWIKLKAFFKVIFGNNLRFSTTTKLIKKTSILNNLKYVYPHILILVLIIVGFLYNLILISNNLHPSHSAFYANTFWAIYNIFQINPIIRTTFKI